MKATLATATTAGNAAVYASVALATQGYQLYCVAFTSPPASGSGTADASGTVVVTIAAKGVPLGCFVRDPQGSTVASVTFDGTSLASTMVTLTGDADLGTIQLDLLAGTAHAAAPGGSTVGGTGDLFPQAVTVGAAGQQYVYTCSDLRLWGSGDKPPPFINTLPSAASGFGPWVDTSTGSPPPPGDPAHRCIDWPITNPRVQVQVLFAGYLPGAGPAEGTVDLSAETTLPLVAVKAYLSQQPGSTQPSGSTWASSGYRSYATAWDFTNSIMRPLVAPGVSGTVIVRKVSSTAYEVRLIKVVLPVSEGTVGSPFPPTVTVDGTLMYGYQGT